MKKPFRLDATEPADNGRTTASDMPRGSREWVMARLCDIAEDSNGTAAARVRALELIGRSVGLWQETTPEAAGTAPPVCLFLPDNGRDPLPPGQSYVSPPPPPDPSA